mmetsp:Transcript_10776/g.31904  ORF Transcript_10776/g.31904 Transcript_10776/m.31904 type:complete len:83 (-) Transcript_10776:64-312(-)
MQIDLLFELLRCVLFFRPASKLRKSSFSSSTLSETKEERTFKKKVNLLKFLRWKCRGSGVRFKKVGGVLAAFEGRARNDADA